MTHHVFISYSRRNAEMMTRVRDALSQANLQVWTDERLVPGTPSWKNSIEQAIQAAQCVVVLMSPSAKASEWVERELDYAYVLQRPIFPVLVDGTQRDAVPFEIINIQYVDLRTDFEQGMQYLIQSLQAHLAQFPISEESPELSEQIASKNLLNQRLPALVKRGVGQLRERMAGSFAPLPVIAEPEYPVGLVTHWKNLSRVMFWYFFMPRKFRRLTAIVNDVRPNYLHTVIITIVFMWVLLPTYFLLIRDPNSVYGNSIFIFFSVSLYGFLAFVPLSVPYRSRRAFVRLIFSGLFLIMMLAFIIGIILSILIFLPNLLTRGF